MAATTSRRLLILAGKPLLHPVGESLDAHGGQGFAECDRTELVRLADHRIALRGGLAARDEERRLDGLGPGEHAVDTGWRLRARLGCDSRPAPERRCQDPCLYLERFLENLSVSNRILEALDGILSFDDAPLGDRQAVARSHFEELRVSLRILGGVANGILGSDESRARSRHLVSGSTELAVSALALGRQPGRPEGLEPERTGPNDPRLLEKTIKLVVNRARLCVGDLELPEQRENPLAVGH